MNSQREYTARCLVWCTFCAEKGAQFMFMHSIQRSAPSGDTLVLSLLRLQQHLNRGILVTKLLKVRILRGSLKLVRA